MATITVVVRHLGIIETSGAPARDAAEQVIVIVILPSQELFIARERFGQVHLVARRAELRGLM